MAITGSDAKIVTTTRDSLNSTTVDIGVLGGSTLTEMSANATAGITEQMESSISNAISSYRKNILSIVGKLEDVGSEAAFKGPQIKTALTSFIEQIKEVSKSYLNGPSEAEKEIIKSVATAYRQQDEDLSGQLGSDTRTVENSSWKGNSSEN